MRITSRTFSLATVGTALMLGACTDEVISPVAPAPEKIAFNLAPSFAAAPEEQIYIIDNYSVTSSGNDNTGSGIYTIDLSSGVTAALTLLVDLTGTCVGAVDCNVSFDQAHVGATPDGARVYAVNRRRVPAAGGNPIGYYDRALNQFIYVGQVSGLPLDGTVLVAFAPDGRLFVANQDANRLYRIDLSTLAVAESWAITTAGGTAVDLLGADIAFGADGTLYLWTNSGGQGLYRIDFLPGQAIGTRLGTGTFPFVTGLAIRGAGSGDLLGSSSETDILYTINKTTGALGTTFPLTLGGNPFDHTAGDMTTGLLVLPTPNLEVTKVATPPDVDAGNPVGFEIVVSSTGTAPALAVTLSDALPVIPGGDWSISQPPATGTCTINAGTLGCDFGTLAPGTSVTVAVTHPTSSVTSCGTYPNTVTVAGTGLTATATATATVRNCQPPGTPKIKVYKKALDDKVKGGDPVGFSMTVLSYGTAPATNVTLSDPLPVIPGGVWTISQAPSTGTCAIAAGTLTCNFGTMAPGTWVTVKVTHPTEDDNGSYSYNSYNNSYSSSSSSYNNNSYNNNNNSYNNNNNNYNSNKHNSHSSHHDWYNHSKKCKKDHNDGDRCTYVNTVTVTGSGITVTDQATVTVYDCKVAATFIVLDEGAIKKGQKYFERDGDSEYFSSYDVNDPSASYSQRKELKFFDDNKGKIIELFSGKVGDEGWFALQTILPSWGSAGPTADGLRNYLKAGPGLGSGGNPTGLLGSIPNVMPLRAEGLELLEGLRVCAVVLDGNVGTTYGPITGNLKSKVLGIVAFEVLNVTKAYGYSSGTLPKVKIEILNASDVCGGSLDLFTEAPAPSSSSSPFDINPSSSSDDTGYTWP